MGWVERDGDTRVHGNDAPQRVDRKVRLKAPRLRAALEADVEVTLGAAPPERLHRCRELRYRIEQEVRARLHTAIHQ